MPSIIKYIGTIKQGLSLVVVEDGLVLIIMKKNEFKFDES